MRKISAVFLLLGILILTLWIISDGNLRSFLYVPSLVMVVGGTVCFSLVNFSLTELIQAFRCALGHETDVHQMTVSQKTFECIGEYILGFGMFSFFVHQFDLLSNLETLGQIIHNIGNGISGIFYAIVLYLIFILPVETQLKKRLQAHDISQLDSMKLINSDFLALSVISVLGIETFLITLMAFFVD